jgi:hypothetical protein
MTSLCRYEDQPADGRLVVLAVTLMTCAVSSCTLKPEGESVAERQSFILEASNEVLAMLYDQEPELEAAVETAPGYAVFKYRLTKLPLFPLGGFGAGGGYGVLIDNRTERQVFMKVEMGEWGWGLGTRVFGSAFLFEDEQVMDAFGAKGWEFGAGADAALKSNEAGVATNVGVARAPGMRIYVISKSGAGYAATLRGTKYSKDGRLN